MDKNKDTETDKIEQRRAETKARLDALKAKDGTKKPIKTGSRFGRILFPIIVVLLVLVVAVWVVFATGLPQRYAVPLRVGTEKVSILEYRHLANLVISEYDASIKKSSTNFKKEFEKAKEYNRNLSPKSVPDAFSAKEGHRDRA